MKHRCLVSALFAIAVLAASRLAPATPNFPGAIKGKLAATDVPQCAICHVCGVTGRGTVNTPWGSAMRARGLEAYNEGSLGTALAKMETDRVDSDGDGTIDVEAVKAGKDPNPPTCEAGDEDPTVPQYGCFGRVASEGGPQTTQALVLFGLLFTVMVARRRRVGSGALSGILVAALGSAALVACQSGASLAPRPELLATKRTPPPPRMGAVRKSEMATELVEIGLDPRRLPPFEALEPRQLRRVMSTFTRSLGFACTDCHDASDYRVPTNVKRITVHMWNEMTRGFLFEGGAPVYCDSCHQGQGKILNRTRGKKAVAAWMSENFTGKLSVASADPDVECEKCHGDPFEPSILARWTK